MADPTPDARLAERLAEIAAEWGDAVAAISGCPGAPPAEAIDRLVIDPEGEYHTLRERFDYILAAPAGGDTVAHPRTAKLLAERLLQLGVSAILDIYELNPDDRALFVQRFLDALVNAPRDLWHPALVVLDEAHVYAPEGKENASTAAVKALASRGRKRGFALVPATQRLAKLSKDVAAECNNKLIGRCTLDVDIKRAAEELGFTTAEQRQALRHLEPGQFYAFGPAFAQLTNDRGVVAGYTQKRPAHSGHGGGQGVHRRFEGNAAEHAKQPRAESKVGVRRDWQKRPRTDGDSGVRAESHRRWQGGGAGGGSGVHAPTLARQMPDLSGSRGASGRGIHGVGPRTDGLYDYLGALAERLRRVRVCCGDWSRVLTPSVTTYIGTTGVLLDPPYSQDRRAICYSEDHDVSADVRRWAIEHGENPQFRIALCGYEGEHDMPDGWTVAEWKAHGGYSRSERGVANREAERIWFSPHCLMPGRRGQQVLFFDEVAS